MELLRLGSNHKIDKSDALGEYLTAHLDLAPASLSGVGNVCPKASPGCKEACLNTAGWGATDKVQDSRIARTKYFFQDRESFLYDLDKDIRSFINKCKRKKVRPAIRLNMTSDILWERLIDMTAYKAQFYDYTKIPNRVVPGNYHLTFSLDETNLDSTKQEMARFNRNVAVVVIPQLFNVIAQDPSEWLLYGYPVINGDLNDLRFLDPAPSAVMLKAKGKARYENTGFVLDTYSPHFNHREPSVGSVCRTPRGVALSRAGCTA